MSPDFENTMLRHYATGKIIRTADGKPMLYKHFLNDMYDDDDDEVEKVPRITAEEEAVYYSKRRIKLPKSLIEELEVNKKHKNKS